MSNSYTDHYMHLSMLIGAEILSGSAELLIQNHIFFLWSSNAADVGTLVQTPSNGRERHCINGAGWTAEKTRVC